MGRLGRPVVNRRRDGELYTFSQTITPVVAESGEVQHFVAIHRTSRPRPCDVGVALTIDDDGPGIPEADWQRLLEPFQQGTEAGTPAQPGTGVGLALVNAFGDASVPAVRNHL